VWLSEINVLQFTARSTLRLQFDSARNIKHNNSRRAVSLDTCALSYLLLYRSGESECLRFAIITDDVSRLFGGRRPMTVFVAILERLGPGGLVL